MEIPQNMLFAARTAAEHSELEEAVRVLPFNINMRPDEDADPELIEMYGDFMYVRREPNGEEAHLGIYVPVSPGVSLSISPNPGVKIKTRKLSTGERVITYRDKVGKPASVFVGPIKSLDPLSAEEEYNGVCALNMSIEGEGG